jgi:hypothetical protein
MSITRMLPSCAAHEISALVYSKIKKNVGWAKLNERAQL